MKTLGLACFCGLGLGVCLGLLSCGGGDLAAQSTASGWQQFRFRGCYDGDTCYFDFPNLPAWLGRNLPIRLAHVDTPELQSRCEQEHRLAVAAKEFTQAELAQSSQIGLSEFHRGKYFRVIARITVDGQDLGQLLLSRQLARPYEGGARGSWCGGVP